MSLIGFLDAYTLRARLFPAVLATVPAFAALALFISWNRIALPNMFATGASLVLLFALADWARRAGLHIESGIYNDLGGKPSVTMFRRGEPTIDESAKEQYRQFVAGKINRAAPAAQEEAADQAAADSFYEQAGIWLRTNTRDAKRFPILWSELLSYGFRRNLLGLKWSALVINAIVVLFSAFVIWRREGIGISEDVMTRATVVLIVAAIHAAYFALVVTRESVKEAARRYGRELILSCQKWMPSHPAPRKLRDRVDSSCTAERMA